jgi:hypothetical protein
MTFRPSYRNSTWNTFPFNAIGINWFYQCWNCNCCICVLYIFTVFRSILFFFLVLSVPEGQLTCLAAGVMWNSCLRLFLTVTPWHFSCHLSASSSSLSSDLQSVEAYQCLTITKHNPIKIAHVLIPCSGTGQCSKLNGLRLCFLSKLPLICRTCNININYNAKLPRCLKILQSLCVSHKIVETYSSQHTQCILSDPCQ